MKSSTYEYLLFRGMETHTKTYTYSLRQLLHANDVLGLMTLAFKSETKDYIIVCHDYFCHLERNMFPSDLRQSTLLKKGLTMFTSCLLFLILTRYMEPS